MKLAREHKMALENGSHFAAIMQKLRKVIIKKQQKPFTLDPALMNHKDSSATKAKKENWADVENELRKFSIRLNKEQISAIVNGLRLSLLKELLERLMEVDQKLQAPPGKKPLKPWQVESASEKLPNNAAA